MYHGTMPALYYRPIHSNTKLPRRAHLHIRSLAISIIIIMKHVRSALEQKTRCEGCFLRLQSAALQSLTGLKGLYLQAAPATHGLNLCTRCVNLSSALLSPRVFLPVFPLPLPVCLSVSLSPSQCHLLSLLFPLSSSSRAHGILPCNRNRKF